MNKRPSVKHHRVNRVRKHREKMAPSIDAALIQPVEARPSIGSIIYLENAPIIDLAPLQLAFSDQNSSKEEAMASIAKQVHNAMKEWAFFVVINHGVSPDLWSNLKKAMAGFSALPYEEKKKVGRDISNPWGYNDKDHTKNVRDWVEVFDFMAETEELEIPENMEPDCKETKIIRNLWPEKPEDYKQICQDFAQGTLKLLYQLMELISLSLGLPSDRLHRYFEKSTCYVRTNHYAPCSIPELALGKGPHRDPTAFTLLTTDEVSGFEVQRRSDSQWLRLRPIPNSYIIVGGDVVQVWSNDIYDSVTHRVVLDSHVERFSAILAAVPSYHAIVKPLEELVDEKNTANYGEYKWGEYLMSRRFSNFKKLDKPVIEVAEFKKSK
ncbi:hypothetical protein AMTRI_Chr13g124770 [Amborella trichopoda]